MFDIAEMTAEPPAYGPTNQPDVTICMTSIRDVARFVTKSIDLQTWPPELRMCGERVTVHNLTILIQRLKSKSKGSSYQPFAPQKVELAVLTLATEQRFQPLTNHNPSTLRAELATAAARGDRARGMKLQMLIATAEGRYDFAQHNLNSAFPRLQVERFASWFVQKWDLE